MFAATSCARHIAPPSFEAKQPPSEVPMTVTGFVHRSTSAAQSALLFLLPHGGQNLARRNAWVSMSADAARARSRREAAVAMSRAVAEHRVAATG
ncbi:MAG: hypothetical protein NVSMB55_06440 [Mycobacteriales bacterium]